MKKYLILETGNSAHTEFLMNDGGFEETSDAILVDEIEAESEQGAYEILINSPKHKDKSFDNLVIKQVV